MLKGGVPFALTLPGGSLLTRRRKSRPDRRQLRITYLRRVAGRRRRVRVSYLKTVARKAPKPARRKQVSLPEKTSPRKQLRRHSSLSSKLFKKSVTKPPRQKITKRRPALIKPVKRPARPRVVPVPIGDNRGWITLDQFTNYLSKRYRIRWDRSDDFQDWIQWVNIDRPFLDGVRFAWKAKALPPYRGQGFYFTLSVWYVVYDESERKTYLRVYRTKLKDQPDWDDLTSIHLPRAVQRIEEILDNVDYLELRDVPCWTATPVSDWVKHAEKRKNYYLAYAKYREGLRPRLRAEFTFSKWKRMHPIR